jgi:hypothetical protein
VITFGLLTLNDKLSSQLLVCTHGSATAMDPKASKTKGNGNQTFSPPPQLPGQCRKSAEVLATRLEPCQLHSGGRKVNNPDQEVDTQAYSTLGGVPVPPTQGKRAPRKAASPIEQQQIPVNMLADLGHLDLPADGMEGMGIADASSDIALDGGGPELTPARFNAQFQALSQKSKTTNLQKPSAASQKAAQCLLEDASESEQEDKDDSG